MAVGCVRFADPIGDLNWAEDELVPGFEALDHHSHDFLKFVLDVLKVTHIPTRAK